MRRRGIPLRFVLLLPVLAWAVSAGADDGWARRIDQAVVRLERRVHALDQQAPRKGGLETRIEDLEARVRVLEGPRRALEDPIALPSPLTDRTKRLLALSKAVARLKSRVDVLVERRPTAGDAPEGMPAGDERTWRLGVLRDRAAELASLAGSMVAVCSTCRGKGTVRNTLWTTDRYGRRYASGSEVHPCTDCLGHPYALHDGIAQWVFYWLRTPVYRVRFGLVELPAMVPVPMRQDLGLPGVVDAYVVHDKVQHTTLVDPTHALTRGKASKGKQGIEVRWVWASDDDGQPTWFLYDARTDGGWPGEEAPEDAPVAAAPVAGVLTPGILRRIHEAWAKQGRGFLLHGVSLGGGVLRARYYARPAREIEDPQVPLPSDAVAAVRALYEIVDPSAEVRTEWFLMWRDRLGRLGLRQTWEARLSRPVYAKVVWSNLSGEEQADVLEWTTYEDDTWVPWPMPANPDTTPLDDDGMSGPLPSADLGTWKESGGHRFPPRDGYEHPVRLVRSYDDDLDPPIRLGTERFNVEVLVQPAVLRTASDYDKARRVTLRFSVPAAQPGEKLPETITARLYAVIGDFDAMVATMGGKVAGWADGEVVPDLRAPSEYAGLREGCEHVWTRALLLPLPEALVVAGAREAVLRYGTEDGLSVRLSPAALDVLRDLLSRIPK